MSVLLRRIFGCPLSMGIIATSTSKDILSDGTKGRQGTRNDLNGRQVSDELWEEYQENLKNDPVDADPPPDLAEGGKGDL